MRPIPSQVHAWSTFFQTQLLENKSSFKKQLFYNVDVFLRKDAFHPQTDLYEPSKMRYKLKRKILPDGYTVLDVVMYWKETPVRGVEEAELPQFTIIGYETNDRKERLATGIYQRLSLSFKLQRNIGYFVFQTYLPSILIVMLSWVSFWINHEATSARVALGKQSFLLLTLLLQWWKTGSL